MRQGRKQKALQNHMIESFKKMEKNIGNRNRAKVQTLELFNKDFYFLFFYFFHLFLFIGGSLLYNIVVVFAIH